MTMLSEHQSEEELRKELALVLEPRKCVHLALPKEVMTELRIFAIRKGLSVTEIFTEISAMVVEGDSYIARRLDLIKKRKKNKSLKKREFKDNDEIYEHIAHMKKFYKEGKESEK